VVSFTFYKAMMSSCNWNTWC